MIDDVVILRIEVVCPRSIFCLLEQLMGNSFVCRKMKGVFHINYQNETENLCIFSGSLLHYKKLLCFENCNRISEVHYSVSREEENYKIVMQ